MKLLLVAATEAEIAPTLSHFHLAAGSFIEAEKFDVLLTGVGMVATAFALGQKLKDQYSLVLNVGIAGRFDPSVELGEVVNIIEDTFSELGAEDHENFISITALGLGENCFLSSAKIALSLKQVKGITVNKVHGNAKSIAKTTALYQPQTESMEGAAVFYACHQLNLPVLQVRSISNHVEPRNRQNWQIGLAIKNLNEWLVAFLEKL